MLYTSVLAWINSVVLNFISQLFSLRVPLFASWDSLGVYNLDLFWMKLKCRIQSRIAFNILQWPMGMLVCGTH